jgi:hypothetical protein
MVPGWGVKVRIPVWLPVAGTGTGEEAGPWTDMHRPGTVEEAGPLTDMPWYRAENFQVWLPGQQDQEQLRVKSLLGVKRLPGR